MKLHKVSHKNGNTYITIRDTGYIVITLNGYHEVSINDPGTALSIRQMPSSNVVPKDRPDKVLSAEQVDEICNDIDNIVP